MNNLLLTGTIVGFLSPWIFVCLCLYDRRKSEKLWRETLVYLKSASAFEAEDAIDRIKRREKTLLERGLDKMRKEGENLREETGVDDMATDMRSMLSKQYDNGTD